MHGLNTPRVGSRECIVLIVPVDQPAPAALTTTEGNATADNAYTKHTTALTLKKR